MLLVLSTVSHPVEVVADYWQQDLPPLPTPRQEVGVALLDNMIYVIGGILENRTTTDVVERFNIEAGQWELIPPLPDNSRLHHVSAVSVGNKVYAVGGLNSSFRGVRTLYAFDPTLGSWERLADLPTARGAMGVAAIGDRIYATGGQNGGTSFDTFAVYLVQEDRWETLPTMPTARNHLAAVSFDGTFYAIGGRSGTLRDQLEAYDPLENAWTTLSPIPTARGGLAAAVVDESIFVFGGEGNSADPFGIFPQVEAYNPAMDCWQRREDMAVPRHGIGAAAKKDRIFVPGGSPIQGFGVTGIHDAFVPGTSPVGDFDRDSFLSSTDIDMLVAEIAANGHKGIFDLSGDCVIDDTDLSKWLSDAAKHNGFSKAYLRGDADLDGTVNATDLNALALNWQGNTSTWSSGDFIVDGVVNVEDLNELALNWRQSIPTTAAVPEPKCLAMLGIAFGCLGFARQRNRLAIL